MAADEQRHRRRYVPLFYRVAGINALLLLVAVAVTVLVLDPEQLSFAVDEAAVLIAALALLALANLLMLRRVVRPLEALTALARRVDLALPGERMPGASATSEAGELALTFNEMLARLEEERRDSTRRVLAGQEAERLRIARELHDQVGQELTAVLLGLARVHARLEPRFRAELIEAQETVRSSIEDVRRIALELRPEALDDLGLVSALAVLCERVAERSELQIGQYVAEQLPALDPEAELVVYRVAQEALTNVARHSGSDRADVALYARGSSVVLTVTDWGAGLPADRAPGTGIRGMRERATLIGATLRIDGNRDGGGCRVMLSLAAEEDVPARDAA